MDELLSVSLARHRFHSRNVASWKRFDATGFERLLLLTLAVFTITTLAGYGLFATQAGLRFSGEWLTTYPALGQIYRYAFAVFAQVHIALTAAVLLWHVSSRIGWPTFSAFILVVSFTFVVEWRLYLW
jgi:hypothetical protein